jgi:TetR/AcrR family transcriptional repressor of nem operon
MSQATGLEKGGIYRHFSSKEEVAAEAFDYAWQEALKVRMHDLDVTIYSGRLPAFEYGDRCGRRQFCFARARTALHGWRERLSSIVRDGIEREEIRRSIDANKLATLIISSLEGAMMIGRLEKNSEALLAVQSYLDSYLETEVRSHPRSGILRRL